MLENLVYFDNAATTRMDTKVLEAMLPYLGASYGNASAKYSIGFEARKAVNTAREQVAALIGAYPDEIYFTSGATESNNIVLRHQDGAIITSEAEHPSVLNTARYCQSKGRAAAYIKPDMSGRIGADNLKKAFEGTAAGRTGMGLVSLMYVNNELGNVYPISELADTAHMHGWIFHTDAVQALGHMEIDVKKSGIDMLSASAHKLYGPKGIGLLYVRRGIKKEGLLKGGSQERGMRPGTENAAGIAGFGKACEIAKESMKENAVREKEIAGFLKEFILKNIPDSVQNGEGERILNFSFHGINGTSLALRLDMEGICVSTGSACSLGTEEISHVLRSIGLDETLAEGSLRISIGKYNTLDEAENAAKKISELVSELRALTV